MRLAETNALASSGHHNDNYVVPLPSDVAGLVRRVAGTPVTVRVRRTDALPVVIRTWQDEARILDALEGRLPRPECLWTGSGFALHTYVPGVPLSSLCGDYEEVHKSLVSAVAWLFARMAEVPRDALPALPADWPADHRDSQAFLRALALAADQQIRQANWAAYGGLFRMLGISGDALRRFAERVPEMTRRPYSLLHADLHRDNLIVSYDNEPPLICVDWELATYGDPLHDLATHLVRMRYPSDQWQEVIDTWADVMVQVRPEAVRGMEDDLRHYVKFEYAQSVYADVMRAAEALKSSSDRRGLDVATTRVREALERGADALELRKVPGQGDIERTLFRWRAARRRGESRSGAARIVWKPDRRVPEHPAFSHAAVTAALMQEAVTPADQIFEGTTHLNSLVRVPGGADPVIVRRKLPEPRRLERCYLSEHAVLRAIELSGAPVPSPRVLALGESEPGNAFTVISFVGPRDGSAPDHPVEGLSPREADALVDHLAALTQVDCRALDPASHQGDFYWWIYDQLVLLVGDLGQESKDLARQLGLPNAADLRKMLSKAKVTRREPSLLHGALNPWNLVRRGDHQALSIIDWEMALIGDPLYDLVRHMHLTPTTPDIRRRMFDRWKNRLHPKYTKDWEQDWRVYRKLEYVRSAYVDLDRMVTRAGRHAPNVRRAVASYARTLSTAAALLEIPVPEPKNRYLTIALR
ncbi:aminoglycoside phosphotransferase family protein [Streptomyces sp. NPDC005648]|uniref:phosphotransferase family protein n=1 Tax=Streptomyces sp. NPDC005648 TaxID=3157044 RepID=UPI0033AA9129